MTVHWFRLIIASILLAVVLAMWIYGMRLARRISRTVGITASDPEYHTILDYCEREGIDATVLACPTTDGKTISFAAGIFGANVYRIPVNPDQKVPT